MQIFLFLAHGYTGIGYFTYQGLSDDRDPAAAGNGFLGRGRLANRHDRLEFRLRSARLYCFWIE